MYCCNDWATAQRMMAKTLNIAREAEWKHCECPEELESLQLLCQFLHSTKDQETRKQIEWVFTELGIVDLLILAPPSPSPSL